MKFAFQPRHHDLDDDDDNDDDAHAGQRLECKRGKIPVVFVHTAHTAHRHWQAFYNLTRSGEACGQSSRRASILTAESSPASLPSLLASDTTAETAAGETGSASG